MNGISLASITFVVISLTAQLEGLKSAPVSAPFLIDDKRHEIDITPIEFKSDKLITVVFLPCGEKGRQKFSIESQAEKESCFNVDLSTDDAIVTTKPEGLKLQIFEGQFCTGKSALYDPKSSQRIPFKISSFQVLQNYV